MTDPNTGLVAAIFPLLRTALESASYGQLIERDPVLADVWTHRHCSEVDKKACSKAFTLHPGIVHLKDVAPDVYDPAKLTHEGTIDFGAHPNLKGVASHLSIDVNPSGRHDRPRLARSRRGSGKATDRGAASVQ
ncbi:hypothetical protein [Pseudochrobactrum sp. MP213Fo]|uniref:hypothetical protein n=1 Tax=Pseudochrobactrum sp. MP213Fo TaxID=3022250 RepID=UPI003BA2793D